VVTLIGEENNHVIKIKFLYCDDKTSFVEVLALVYSECKQAGRDNGVSSLPKIERQFVVRYLQQFVLRM
jgi:hypothetical protein